MVLLRNTHTHTASVIKLICLTMNFSSKFILKLSFTASRLRYTVAVIHSSTDAAAFNKSVTVDYNSPSSCPTVCMLWKILLNVKF